MKWIATKDFSIYSHNKPSDTPQDLRIVLYYYVLLAIHEHKCNFPFTFALWQSQDIYMTRESNFLVNPARAIKCDCKAISKTYIYNCSISPFLVQALPITILKCQARSKAKTTGGAEQKMVKQNYSPPGRSLKKQTD